MTQDATSEALRLFSTAIELDPDFATPYGAAAFCYVVRKINGWTGDRLQEMAETARLARVVAHLGKDDALARAFGGLALGYVAGDLEGAIALVERALQLNPNLAIAWYASGTVRAFRGGEPDTAIDHLLRAMRLSPRDPFMFTMQGVTAFAHFCAGRRGGILGGKGVLGAAEHPGYAADCRREQRACRTAGEGATRRSARA
jgi:tetratricopeptide (TPR) repeat protein